MKSTGSHTVIAIDGPAASGKSSVACELARRLGYIYVNSGAMYRAMTWLVLERGIDPADANAIARLAESAPLRCELRDRDSVMLIDGVDPEPFLREDRVNDNVSLVSSVPRVREILVAQLRRYAETNDLVMEGRDIGTVVFPHAPVKIFLDASPEKRGERRYEQNRDGAVATQLPVKVLEEIHERDRRDRTRADSPLRPAPDAAIIDSTDLTLEQVIEKAAALVEGYLGGSDL